MKKIVLVLSITFLLSGCLEYSSLVKLNSDGSGTVEETVLMSDFFFQMMRSFAESFSDSLLTNDDLNIFDEEQLKMQASEMGTGVKYLKGEKIQINGKDGYKAYFSFETITTLRLSENPDDKLQMGEFVDDTLEVEEKEYITFNFVKNNPSVLEINFPSEMETDFSDEEIPDSTETEIDDDFMNEQAKEFLKDFKVSIQVQIGENIIETNATFRENNIITLLQMDFEKLMEIPDKFEELNKANPETLRETKELLKNIPGFKVELNEKVFVKFN